MGNVFTSLWQSFRSLLYDSIILNLTTKWYEVVLSQLDQGSTVLDVGIGTAGAIVQCKDILLSRQIRVIGIDNDAGYVRKARETIHHAGLDHVVSVIEGSVYDVDWLLEKDLKPTGGHMNHPSAVQDEAHLQRSNILHVDQNQFDAIYFSGSFSLLPDLPRALNVVKKLLRKPGGKIFITQTYQRYTPPFLKHIKPFLRYLTTIDFGKLYTETEAHHFFHQIIVTKCDLDCMEHTVIKGSVDTFLQAAYLTILKTRSSS